MKLSSNEITKSQNALNLPRDEIAFRKEYQELTLKRKLTTVFRPGNRVYPNWRGYKEGEIVTLRVIEKCGCDEEFIPPTFNKIKLKVQIASIKVIDIETLDTRHFYGSSPDVHDIPSLKKHLGRIYRKPDSYYDDEQVTQICIRYLD